MITSPPRRLIDKIVQETGADEELIKRALTIAFETIKEEAAEGTVMIRGFGTFYTLERKGCVRPLPSNTSRTIEVPATRRLSLRSVPDRF